MTHQYSIADLKAILKPKEAMPDSINQANFWIGELSETDTKRILSWSAFSPQFKERLIATKRSLMDSEYETVVNKHKNMLPGPEAYSSLLKAYSENTLTPSDNSIVRRLLADDAEVRGFYLNIEDSTLERSVTSNVTNINDISKKSHRTKSYRSVFNLAVAASVASVAIGLSTMTQNPINLTNDNYAIKGVGDWFFATNEVDDSALSHAYNSGLSRVLLVSKPVFSQMPSINSVVSSLPSNPPYCSEKSNCHLINEQVAQGQTAARELLKQFSCSYPVILGCKLKYSEETQFEEKLKRIVIKE